MSENHCQVQYHNLLSRISQLSLRLWLAEYSLDLMQMPAHDVEISRPVHKFTTKNDEVYYNCNIPTHLNSDHRGNYTMVQGNAQNYVGGSLGYIPTCQSHLVSIVGLLIHCLHDS